ncbi:MAG: alpha-L-rhamnosidase C-terminal domain-containing protein [Limisphaerales bacterium]
MRARPRLGEAHDSSVYGRLEGAWERRGGELELRVSVPANSAARLCVAATEAANETEGGRAAWRAAGAQFLRESRFGRFFNWWRGDTISA